MSWNIARVQDVCEIRSGKRLPKGCDFSTEKTKYPYIRARDIKAGKINGDNLVYLTEDVQKKISQYIVNTNDVAITIVGASVGDVAFVTKDFDGFNLTENAVRLTNFSKNVNSRYIAYILNTPKYYEIMQQIAGGSAQPKLGIYKIGPIEIPCPPLETQRKIASILSAYDDLIENNRRQIKLLEEAAQRLYKEWFVDLRFPGHENAKIIDGVPEGWRKGTLGEIISRLEAGSRPKGGIDNLLIEGIASVGAENVIGLGQYNFASEKLITKEFFSKMKKGIIANKDILIYKDGAYIGRTSLFQDGFPHNEAAVNEHVFLLHTENEKLQYYTFFTLYQKEYFMKMQKLNKNAAQPGLNQNAIISLEIVIPQIAIVEKFDYIVTASMKNIFAKAKQNKILSEARDRLLPKLMSGEIKI